MRTISIFSSLALSLALFACVESPDDDEVELVDDDGTPLPSATDDPAAVELYLPKCSSEPPVCPPGTHPRCLFLGEYTCV